MENYSIYVTVKGAALIRPILRFASGVEAGMIVL